MLKVQLLCDVSYYSTLGHNMARYNNAVHASTYVHGTLFLMKQFFVLFRKTGSFVSEHFNFAPPPPILSNTVML